MLEVIFLGTSGSIPTPSRGMPALMINYWDKKLLWDCGEGTQRQMMNYKVGFGSIDAIFVTHPHLDHYLGVFGLLETLNLSFTTHRPLDLVLPSTIVDNIRDYPFVKITKMKKGVVYKTSGFRIEAFPVQHTRQAYGLLFIEEDRRKFDEKKAHSLGLQGKMFSEIQKTGRVIVNGKKILLNDVSWVKPGRRIVYTGDSAPSDAIVEAAKGADLLIHDGTYAEEHETEAKETNHSMVTDAAQIAKKAKVKQLVLVHISPRYPETGKLLAQAQKIFKNTAIAVDGFRIKL